MGIFWTIVDVVVEQGGAYSAQGLFNPFWEPKRGGFSSVELAQFNSPSCVLLYTPDDRRVFTSGDVLAADFLLAHYGETVLKGAVLEWNLELEGPRFVAAKTDGTKPVPPVHRHIPIGDIAIGPVRKVASENIGPDRYQGEFIPDFPG